MEDSSLGVDRLLTWALGNQSAFRLNLTELTGMGALFPGASDYLVELNWTGTFGIGRGSDFEPKIALAKALAEAIEDCVFRASGSRGSSNGMAAYPSLEGAKERARRELLERDHWLCHYLTRTAPMHVSLGGKRSKSRRFEKECEVQGTRLSFYRSFRSSAGETVIALADGRRARHPFGLIAGFGFSEDPREALLQAQIECARNLIPRWKETSSPTYLDRAVIGLGEMCGPKAHRAWGLNPAAAQGLATWIDVPVSENGVAIHELDNRFEILHQPEAVVLSPPIYVVRCENPRLQSLAYGPTVEAWANLPRLREFTRKTDFGPEDLNPDPHFIG